MITAETIDANSPHLETVMRLGRQHSATVGYMPDGAFFDHAQARHIIVALNGSECVGYILYRISRRRVVIAHFCVAEEHRKQGAARAMLAHLIATTQHCYGITLSCRKEFEANKSWERLKFHFVRNRLGRKKGGSILSVWAIDYKHQDLFSDQSNPSALKVAIDSNIFFDLVEHRNPQSEALQEDWLVPLISLCYTPELLNEINRQADDAVRRQRMIEVQQFEMLQCTPAEFAASEELIKPLFPALAASQQNESDFRHLVRAHAAEADAFVTRDEELLARSDEMFELCGLPVVRPAELIGRIDFVERAREYQRRFVAGTRRIVKERISCAEETLACTLLSQGEPLKQMLSALNSFIADPQRVRCFKISEDGVTLAAYAVRRENGIDTVPLLRICAKRRASTIARSVLTGLIRDADSANANAVFITESILPEIIRAACADLGFIPVSGGMIKIVLRGLMTCAEAASRIAWPDPKIEELKATVESASVDLTAASQIEHLLSPAKLSDSILPTYVVSIRADFADTLIDERLAEGDIFGTDVDLALNSESAYYRSAKTLVLTCPARVLWYVSDYQKYRGTKTVRACSRIVELAVGKPKELYSRFKRLGVFDWHHVFETADRDLNKEIMAFRFDDTELIPPVPLELVQKILADNGVGDNNMVGPFFIPPKVFGEIYAAAFNSSEIRGIDSGRNEDDRATQAAAANE